MKWTFLRNFDCDPDRLERYSFVRRDESSTDSVRWVWFERVLDSNECNLRLVIRIEFELAISDEPGASYRENRSYSFNRVVLEVDKVSDEPDKTEFLGEYELNIQTLREVKQLANLLQTHSRFGPSG